jgi:hypothetical protein
VVTNARAFYTTRAAAGATGTRLSLRPLIEEDGMFSKNLGRIARRERTHVCEIKARNDGLLFVIIRESG